MHVVPHASYIVQPAKLKNENITDHFDRLKKKNQDKAQNSPISEYFRTDPLREHELVSKKEAFRRIFSGTLQQKWPGAESCPRH